MSQMGQKATFGRSRFKSVQLPTADVGILPRHVRKVPICDIQGRTANGGEPGAVISFGHANDTTGFDIEFNILLPMICDQFSYLRNRRHRSANFTPTGHHHLRIGNTAQHGVTRHSNPYGRAVVFLTGQRFGSPR